MRNFRLNKTVILSLFAALAAVCLASDTMVVFARMATLLSGPAPAPTDPADIHLAGVLGLAAEIIIFLVIAILSYVLIPKPKPTTPEAPDPYGIDEFKVPTASAGREIPVVFGTRWIDAPNVVWYGHLRVEEKKEKTCT